MINDRPWPGECDKRMQREQYYTTIYRGKDATTTTLGRDSGGYDNTDDTATTLTENKKDLVRKSIIRIKRARTKTQQSKQQCTI